MFAAYDKAIEEISVDYTKYSSLEVCIARLKKLCQPTEDYPYSLIDLTELFQINDHHYNFVLNAFTSFSFYTRVTGSFEKVNDTTVRIQFTVQVYKGQVVTFTLFAMVFSVVFGLLFLANHFFPFLLFALFPISSLYIALKRASNYRNELVAKLSAL